MKIVSLILSVLLSYNLSALACGSSNEPVHKLKTKGSEVAVQIGNKEVLIFNSGSGAIKAKDELSSPIVPIRFELASESKSRQVVVQTDVATTFLTAFAMYRCLGTPVQTADVYVPITKYGEIKIFLLKRGEMLIPEGKQPDLVLKGEDALKLIK